MLPSTRSQRLYSKEDEEVVEEFMDQEQINFGRETERVDSLVAGKNTGGKDLEAANKMSNHICQHFCHSSPYDVVI